MASMEYINSAKRAGVYSYLLNYISAVNSGGNPPVLPGEQHVQQQVQQQPQALPRTLQPNFNNGGGPGATHPSMINAPNASYYTQQSQQSQQ